MLEKANQETMRALKTNDGSAPVTAGRKVSTVEAYRKVEDIPSSREPGHHGEHCAHATSNAGASLWLHMARDLACGLSLAVPIAAVSKPAHA